MKESKQTFDKLSIMYQIHASWLEEYILRWLTVLWQYQFITCQVERYAFDKQKWNNIEIKLTLS